eukprot:129814-Heterocapsa_arctica.AAC.1
MLESEVNIVCVCLRGSISTIRSKSDRGSQATRPRVVGKRREQGGRWGGDRGGREKERRREGGGSRRKGSKENERRRRDASDW